MRFLLLLLVAVVTAKKCNTDTVNLDGARCEYDSVWIKQYGVITPTSVLSLDLTQTVENLKCMAQVKTDNIIHLLCAEAVIVEMYTIAERTAAMKSEIQVRLDINADKQRLADELLDIIHEARKIL